MELNWLESVLFGFVSGLSDILPVSAQAHKLILLKLFGVKTEPGLLRLLIHISILGALYYNCLPHIVKIIRAKALARIPKKKRRRPLDYKSLMDFRLWQTMILPVILVFFLYEKVSALHSSLSWMAIFLFVNGIILYIPPFLPGSNKDSRNLSRVELTLVHGVEQYVRVGNRVGKLSGIGILQKRDELALNIVIDDIKAHGTRNRVFLNIFQRFLFLCQSL